MPALIDADADSCVIVLEHIDGGDCTGMYNGAILPEDTLDALLDYARSLHRIGVTRSAQLANRDMRALNHEHIFRFPLAESNGLPLDAITPGLQAAADALKRDARFVERVHALGDIYLADGDTLVHGDFFPGSWLASDRGPIVIDPEFCFLGAEEFDYGVLLAHLMLGNQPRARHDPIVAAASDGLDRGLVRGFAGVEIMRRLIGVAQLPLQASLEQKRAWLECARELCQS
jgi:5-methylthioribose kinase